jgi:hypothetical protein
VTGTPFHCSGSDSTIALRGWLVIELLDGALYGPDRCLNMAANGIAKLLRMMIEEDD